MPPEKRQFKLKIWALALGYFIFYAPYSAFIKATTAGLWPGVGGAVSGFQLLPATALSTAVALPLIISLMGWWKYAGRRQIFGLSIPFPGGLVFLSGLGTAIIIGTTTLIFTFDGVSIVFALVLMRGGVLVIAPVVDRLFNRRVRWFSWAALGLSLASLLIALVDVNNYRISVVVALTVAAYLSGYVLRLPCMNKMGKSNDAAVTRGYFVGEIMVAMPLLVFVPAVVAFFGGGEIASQLRYGFTNFFASGTTLPAVLIGKLYAGLYCFGTLIYLDCRENTFCIPLNRCSSLLSGVFASYALALFFDQRPPSIAQLGSAALIVVALLLLSPLHHFQPYLTRLSRAFASVRRMVSDFATGSGKQEPSVRPALQSIQAGRVPNTCAALTDGEQADRPGQVFLFVCSGNTCRSPIAATICNAEIAARLKIQFETRESMPVQAQSAGLAASVGAPMMPEAQQALSLLNVPTTPHSARSLTAELAHQVERIFCMTQAHRSAVIDMFPSAAGKTQCLDPNGDIEDPIGRGLAAYVQCARRIRDVVQLRLDEISL